MAEITAKGDKKERLESRDILSSSKMRGHSREGKKKRRSCALILLLCVVLLLAGLYIYMRFEYRNIKVTEIDLQSEALQGVKIVFAADFQYDMHRSSPNSMEEKTFQTAVDRINAQQADMILLGGDYQTYVSNSSAVQPYLSQLSAPLGVYGIFGNHDDGVEDDLAEGLGNITFLKNETVQVKYGDAVIEIYGVEDLWTGNPQIQAEKFTHTADYRILLSHNPDVFGKLEPELAGRFDLMLAGHVHAGQITFFGLFGLPPVINHATAYGELFRYGEKSYNGSRCYITSGLGGDVFHQPLRFGAQPEIVVIS